MTSRRFAINTLTTLLLLAGLWWMLTLESRPAGAPDTLMVRKISSAALPPPPSPPPSQSAELSNSAVNLSLAPTPSATRLKVTPLEVPLPELNLPAPLAGSAELDQSLAFRGEGLLESISTFGLDELDDAPRLLSPITARLPAELKRQGARQGKLVLHVIIHETGQVELVDVAESQYTQLAPLADKIVRQARFTAPKRQGQKVKAEFLWPIKVSS